MCANTDWTGKQKASEMFYNGSQILSEKMLPNASFIMRLGNGEFFLNFWSERVKEDVRKDFLMMKWMKISELEGIFPDSLRELSLDLCKVGILK